MAPSVAEVIGGNARRIRLDGGVTLETMAAFAKRYGLPWTTGRVSALEGGTVSPTLGTLYAVASALSAATGEPVSLADLLDGDGDVAVNNDFAAPLAELRAAVSGQPVMGRGEATILAAAAEPLRGFREADIRICKSIGVDPEDAAPRMHALWGRTFSAERDRRTEPGDNAQRRGQISRQLKAELQKAIDDGDD